MENPIDHIIKKELFWNAFQPVIHIETGKTAGYESLFRCEVTADPKVVFDYARSSGKLNDLDRASIKHSVLQFKSIFNGNPYRPYLSMNLFPSTMTNPEFTPFLQELLVNSGIPSGKIILEINEAELAEDHSTLRSSIGELKNEGFIIALDHLGNGNSSLRMLLEIEPDIIKVDRYFGKDLAVSPKKQRLLESLLHFSKGESDFVLVGVETKEDLEAAQNLGITFAQGYYLGMPEKKKPDEELFLSIF